MSRKNFSRGKDHILQGTNYGPRYMKWDFKESLDDVNEMQFSEMHVSNMI